MGIPGGGVAVLRIRAPVDEVERCYILPRVCVLINHPRVSTIYNIVKSRRTG